jgi:hypothetical protein
MNNRLLSKVSVVALLLAVSVPAITTPANAYYDKYNYTEAYYIQSNQSAFWIPDVGANLSDQAHFGSIEYYAANKVASKRIEIPHQKLVNSGGLSDYYVPTGRLFILDRSLYYQAWTTKSTTGTSTANEGFTFESSDSLNIETDIVASALVTEEDAAKFFYWFGQKPTAEYDPNHPEAQFNAVIYGRSLRDIMDTVVRGEVQAALAEEYGKQPLATGITQKADIMKRVFERVRDSYKPMGITIKYIGYANSLNFDPDVQKAMNDNFIASMKTKELATLAPTMPVQQAQTHMQAELIIASKWNGDLKVPSGMWFIPTGFFDSITNFFAPKGAPTTLSK